MFKFCQLIKFQGYISKNGHKLILRKTLLGNVVLPPEQLAQIRTAGLDEANKKLRVTSPCGATLW